MLTDADRALPGGTRTRLIVEPAVAVSLSVLPDEDPDHAAAVSAGSGIPEALLRRHGAARAADPPPRERRRARRAGGASGRARARPSRRRLPRPTAQAGLRAPR